MAAKEFRVIVTKCGECPACKAGFYNPWCRKFPVDTPGINLINLQEIPFWCHLPDSKEVNNA